MPVEQLSLFQDEFVLLNDAAAALKELQPDEALESLRRYRDLYRGGEDVEKKCRIAAFLKKGLSALPPPGPDLAPQLFQLWLSFAAFCASLGAGGAIANELRRPFFQKVVTAIEAAHLTDGTFLAEGIPAGYAHLQTGEYDRAIHSLQACLITAPNNARIYGYLGDAYLLRGDLSVARQVYFEACRIDPAAIDWHHLRDNELKRLLEELSDEHGGARALACAWLPALAYVRGFFRPKQIRLLEEFRVITGSYLELEKTFARTPSPVLAAQLFLQGIILCDNEPFLRMVKGIDFAEVRREMKAADPTLFAAYLKQIDRRKLKGL